jgi:hypothetical protein
MIDWRILLDEKNNERYETKTIVLYLIVVAAAILEMYETEIVSCFDSTYVDLINVFLSFYVL